MVNEIDENNDGEIDFEEFLLLMVKQMIKVEEREEELVEVFNKFDIGGDGQIDAHDLAHRFSVLKLPMSIDECEQILRQHDLDGDGSINFIEFVRIMMAAP